MILKAFNELMIRLGDDYYCIRLQIKEDENFGKAIIETPNGYPQEWEYNGKTHEWE